MKEHKQKCYIRLFRNIICISLLLKKKYTYRCTTQDKLVLFIFQMRHCEFFTVQNELSNQNRKGKDMLQWQIYIQPKILPTFLDGKNTSQKYYCMCFYCIAILILDYIFFINQSIKIRFISIKQKLAIYLSLSTYIEQISVVPWLGWHLVVLDVLPRTSPSAGCLQCQVGTWEWRSGLFACHWTLRFPCLPNDLKLINIIKNQNNKMDFFEPSFYYSWLIH